MRLLRLLAPCVGCGCWCPICWLRRTNGGLWLLVLHLLALVRHLLAFFHLSWGTASSCRPSLWPLQQCAWCATHMSSSWYLACHATVVHAMPGSCPSAARWLKGYQLYLQIEGRLAEGFFVCCNLHPEKNFTKLLSWSRKAPKLANISTEAG